MCARSGAGRNSAVRDADKNAHPQSRGCIHVFLFGGGGGLLCLNHPKVPLSGAVDPLSTGVQTLKLQEGGLRRGTLGGGGCGNPPTHKAPATHTCPLCCGTRDVFIHQGGGGLIPPPPGQTTHPPKTRNFPLGKNEILNREPRMRSPFSDTNFSLPSNPPPSNPPTPCPVGQTLSTTLSEDNILGLFVGQRVGIAGSCRQ